MRKVDNPQATDVLPLQLAMQIVKRFWLLLKGKCLNIVEMVRACQNVGMESYKAQVLAITLQPQKCCNFGNKGHFQKHCRKEKKTTKAL